MHYTLDGLVLRRKPAGEGDRTVQLLTGELGVISAYAKGAQRPRSRLAAATEPLSRVRAVVFRSKGRFYLDAAEVLDGFFELRGDITGLSLAAYIAELAEELSPKEAEAGDYLRLALACLRHLRAGSRSEALIKAVAEMRLLTLAGYMPDLVACAGCGVYEHAGFWFLPGGGEIFCRDCLPDPPGGAVLLGPAALAALRHMLYAAAPDLFGFRLTGGSLENVSQASERYVEAQLERRPRTLDFYRSL